MDGREIWETIKKNNSFVPSPERYKGMEYRRAGRSGLRLSALSFGMWHNFGSTDNYETMRSIVFAAFDGGITVFDLANNYGPPAGAAERNFGSILARDLKAYRDEMIITTKAGFGAWRGPYGQGNGDRKHLIASLDRSLKNIGVDYVDIFYHHRPDPETPVEETCLALKQIADSGKALYIGLSNYSFAQVKAAYPVLKELKVPFVLLQMPYSILDRTIETSGLKAFAHENGFAVTAYSPLAQGLLTDRYLCGIPEDSRMGKGMDLKREQFSAGLADKLSRLNEVARGRGQTLAEMALSWTLKDGDVASAIVGASRPAQIEDDLKIAPTFTAEELAAIDAIVFAKEDQTE